MTGEGTYEWLAGLLTSEMRKAYPNFSKNQKGYGAYDKILENKKVAHLRGLLKNIVCKPDCPLAYMSPRVGMYVYNGCFYENVGEGAVF
ncbi:MAG: hypothetical protein K2H46_03830, partial [Muribaculaceae bacterium]|nr:hypothetical protein [Muribaculaceae bacterium]